MWFVSLYSPLTKERSGDMLKQLLLYVAFCGATRPVETCPARRTAGREGSDRRTDINTNASCDN